jgi:hypothetical protein
MEAKMDCPKHLIEEAEAERLMSILHRDPA